MTDASMTNERADGVLNLHVADSQVVRRCGRFTLTRSPEGLQWVLRSRGGSIWRWHAENKQWLANCNAYRTEKEATAGLEETLAHEQAGDLNEQHVTQRTPELK